ncbi:MAG: phage holin family protein [Acidobacteria bacterium]|nr:phage holin family protein [Acidobacteriota bacterium]MBV9144463.1 phage holin family protein [Acidobacteriota bacterium]MBV9436893.1 phage holin family protein [Acidobacteriota bacterium]
MTHSLVRWLLMSLSLLIVSYVVPGFFVTGIGSALIAALIFGFLNATLGLVLKILTFPFTILTFGLFWFVINAIILEITSAFVRGFFIRSFFSALVGAIVLTLVNMLLKTLVGEVERP